MSEHPPGPRMKSIRLFVRLVLTLNTALLVLQLLRLREPLRTTRIGHFPLLALFAMTAVTLVLWLMSLTNSKTLSARFGDFADRILSRPLLAWLAALTGFELYALLADALDTLLGHDTEILRIVGFITGVSVIAARVMWDRQEEAATHFAKRPVSRREWIRATTLIALAILLLAVLISVWQFFYAQPSVTGDSERYYDLSQQILGHPLRADAIPLKESHATYGYPLLVAVTRLLYDNIVSLAILQHTLRALVAVAAFWELRSTSFHGAALIGLLIASAPITAHHAHRMWTETLYGTLIMLAILMTHRSIVQSGTNRRGTVALILVGALGGVATLVRPTGLLVTAPILIVVVFYTRSWKNTLVISLVLGATLVVLSGGRWLIDGEFRLRASNTDLYYCVPVVRYRLFEPDNGPMAARYAEAVAQEGCAYYSFSEEEIVVRPSKAGQELYQCGLNYSQATGIPLSMQTLYLEGIRAHPSRFFPIFYDEVRAYVGQGEEPLVSFYAGIDNPVPYRNCDERFKGLGNIDPDYTEYACSYTPNHFSALVARLPNLSYRYLVLMQPYRLMGNRYETRFWGALLLFVFALLEAPKYFRSVAGLAGSIIAYHALITAFAQHSLPRYVFVLTPLFATLAGIIAIIVLTALLNLTSARGQ
jgi:hypothetical protein